MTTEAPPSRALAVGRALADRSAWLLPLAIVAGASALGALRGISAAILVLAGGTLLGVITLLWKSLQVLIGEAPLSLQSALDLSAATAADEQKQAVLRALKDLEYERGLGKLSDEDYRELATRYRAEAKAVLRSIDDNLGPARLRAERIIEDRLGAKAPEKAKKKKKRPAPADDASAAEKADVAPGHDATEAPRAKADDEAEGPTPTEASNAPAEASERRVEAATIAPRAETAEAAPEPSAANPSKAGASASADAKTVCPTCSARNDADAAFCKACGARMQPATAAPSEP
jgi:hypothetical protein